MILAIWLCVVQRLLGNHGINYTGQGPCRDNSDETESGVNEQGLRLNLPGLIQQLQHRGRHNTRFLPRQEVSCACDDLASDPCGERGALGGRVRRRSSEAVVSPIQHDGRNRDLGTLRQLAFYHRESRFAGRVPVAVAIRMDHAFDKIRIVK